ncbi:MAG: M28 family peptidase [Candidatus Riflebacteria bacterium]|nr:M28 family peptidase [Candidatus Riflebacteria bacterium]
MTFPPSCIVVLLGALSLGFPSATFAQAVIQPIEAYSERLPDSFDLVWPTGASLPLYRGQPAPVRCRRIPRSEFEDQIEPQALLAHRLLTRAMAQYPSRKVLDLMPVVLTGGPPLPGVGDRGPLWAVAFSLRAGETERQWIPRSIEPVDTTVLLEVARARAHLRRNHPEILDREAFPWGNPAAEIDRAIPDGRLVDLALFLGPHLRAFQRAWEPGARFSYPEVLSFADRRGELDGPVWEKLFVQPETELYDKPTFRTYRFTDRSGRPVRITPGLRDDIRRNPAGFVAWEDPPRTVVEGAAAVYRQLVLVDRNGRARALPGGLSLSGHGGSIPTLVTRDRYPEPPPAFSATRSQLEWIRRLASRLDPNRFMTWIGQLSGEEGASSRFAPGAVTTRFTNRSVRLEGVQLVQVAEFLSNYYRSLGYSVAGQRCRYGDREYRNLIVEIPGETDEWVLLVDHYDTAVASETAAAGRSGMKAAPGADDNGSGTAALMESGRILAGMARWKGAPGVPKRGIRIVHMVGEEFPADCLGAREYVARALASREKIHGAIIVDMIGHAGAGDRLSDPIFQLNQGESPESARLTGAALQAFAALRKARLVPPELKPVIRHRFDRRSFLYNTDGVIFSDVGYPVLLINEHINRLEKLDRWGYHDLADDRSNICRGYAVGLARLALATVLLLATAP